MSVRAWGCFAAVSVLWGIPYLLIKVVVDAGVSAPFMVFGRVVVGIAVLAPIAPRREVVRALRTRFPWVAAFAVVEIVVPFTLLGLGERDVPSSLTAILIAAAPLFVALLALRFDASERVTGPRLGGLLLGLAGVAALVGIDVGGAPLAAVEVLGAAFGYAVGPLILKRHLADLDSRALMTAALAVAAVVLLPFAALQAPRSVPGTGALVSLATLGVLCTAAALVIYAMLVGEVGAGRALVITYINPLVALAAGMAVLGERPGAGAAIGLALILAGSWLSTRPVPDPAALTLQE